MAKNKTHLFSEEMLEEARRLRRETSRGTDAAGRIDP